MRKRKFLTNDTENDVFIVENICKKKIRTNKEPLYLIKWKDWDSKFNTWEPSSNILDKSLIDIFEEEQKEKKHKKESLKTKEHETLKEIEPEILQQQMKNFVPHANETSMDKNEMDSMEKSCLEPEGRPKIYLKIKKHRFRNPNIKLVKQQCENDFLDEEKFRTSHKMEDEWMFPHRLFPEDSSNNEQINKSVKEKTKINDQISRKDLHFWKKNRKLQSEKSLETLDIYFHKPRKLLSINEYSAKMKSHHKLSKPEEYKNEQKSIPLKSPSEVNLETETHKKEQLNNIPLKTEISEIVLEDHVEPESKNSLNDKYQFSELAKDKDIKPINERFKYHADTIVTDVTIKNLSVTIREMSYEDFIDCDSHRYLMIRVPVQSDWLKRYRGSPKTIPIDDEKSENGIFEVAENVHFSMKAKNSDLNQNLVKDITGNIISGFRPLSRPKSIDSFKAALDKHYCSEHIISSLNMPSNSPIQVQEKSIGSSVYDNKSPLHVIIDDCEEVDVVGGIESDQSFVESLQTETMTVSIRQSLPINTSSVTSIIQSLLQSYSCNHSLPMPTLQGAPWIQSQIPSNHLYPLSHLIGRNDICMPSYSVEPNMLKYSENSCLLYCPSDIYVNSNQEMPIDLSLK